MDQGSLQASREGENPQRRALKQQEIFPGSGLGYTLSVIGAWAS